MTFTFLYDVLVAYMPLFAWFSAPLIACFVMLTALSIIYSIVDLRR